MKHPIAIVETDNVLFISGLADHYVEVLTTYRVGTTHDDDAYWARIDGMAGFEARGSTAKEAAAALRDQFVNAIAHPKEYLSLLAESCRTQQADDAAANVVLLAQEQAYRAAAQILHASKAAADYAEYRANAVSSLSKRLPFMAPEIQAQIDPDLLRDAKRLWVAENADDMTEVFR